MVRRPALSTRAWEMRVTPHQQLVWMLSAVQQGLLPEIFNAALGHSRTICLICGFLVAASCAVLEPSLLPMQRLGINSIVSLLTWSHRVIPGELFVSLHQLRRGGEGLQPHEGIPGVKGLVPVCMADES